MEYNLLKQIEPNFLTPMANSTYPTLSAYPAIDYVNPGLGQISRLYSFYVPLFNNDSTYKIEKTTGSKVSEQLGSGVTTETDETPSIDPITFNNRKRKLLGDGVFDSFMHPHFVKTKKISLEKTEKKPKQVPQKTENEKKPKAEMHQFKFY